MTMQGWHDGYAAWQIMGTATTTAYESWYLRSGVGTSWNTAKEIIHSGNIASQSVNYATSAGSAGTTDNIGGVQFRNTGSNAGTNADTIDSNGITYYNAGVSNFSGNATDGALYSQRYSTSWQHQIAGDYRSGQIALRGRNDGTWQDWRMVLDDKNIGSYAVPYGNMTGSTGLNDNKLYLRTNGDNNHYLWNAADDWEELVYYTGTGFRLKGSTGVVPAYFTDSEIKFNTRLAAGNIYYDNLYANVDNTYGFFGRNVYADTINGRGSDPLELNYYDGGAVKIGTGTYGSKELYASMVYVSSGNAVIHAGNIGSQSVSYATDAGTLGGYGRGNTTNKIAYWNSSGNLYVNNPESYSGEVRLGAAWSRGGVYTSGALSMATSSGAIDFVSNDTTLGAFRWDSTNGSRFIVGQNVTTTPYTLIDSNRRPAIYARGAYPVLTLDHTETGNTVHGPTIQFVHNGLDGRQFVIGTNGSGTNLDFGFSNTSSYGNTSYNPHNGIGGYNGKTIMRLTDTGLLIGDTGSYPTFRTPGRDLDVRGSQNISGVLNVNGATEHTVNDNGSVIHGTTTNNRVFINGSIQLTNNNDAIVIGRGTATFLSDEELGFGWGGGWYMTEGSYIRSRNSKSLHMNGGSVDYVGSLYLEGSGTGVHLQPNAGSYGSLQVTGSKNSWHGIRFTGSDVNLMANANEVGFHNNNAGWQFLWSAGTAFVYKGGTGGGTQATVLDSSNYSSYALPLSGGTVTGTTTFNASTYPLFVRSYGNTNAVSAQGLQVYSQDGNGAIMAFHRGGQYAVNMGLDSDNVMRIGGWSAAADRWVLDMSGNNTVAGSFRAPIFYDSNDTSFYVDPNSNSRVSSITATGYLYSQGFIYMNNDNPIVWGSSTSIEGNSSSITIRLSGITAVFNNTGGLYLAGDAGTNTGGLRLKNSSGTESPAMWVQSNNRIIISNANFAGVTIVTSTRINSSLGVNVDASGTAGRIDAGNDIVAYSSSDERLKQNITPIENALDKVKSLTGVEFDWKPEYKQAHGYEGHDTGIIAQQVQEVMPSAVRTNDTGFLAVRYEKLIGLLIEANKELAARVEELEKKLN